MLLIIESADEQVLQKIEELVRPFQVFVRKVANDTDTVSPKERNQRVALVRKFRGGLQAHFTGYQPAKHDWYQQ